MTAAADDPRDRLRPIGDGTCVDCGHDPHPLRTCHEITGAIGGDPANGPDYCRCTIDYLNGAMEAEIARLTLLAAAPPPQPEADSPALDVERLARAMHRVNPKLYAANGKGISEWSIADAETLAREYATDDAARGGEPG